MKYDNILKAKFVSRPNRFIAHIDIDGNIETVHVKNTGRCKELLIPGCFVYITEPKTKGRKTKYDLVAVEKSNGFLINIDSQAPNKVMKQWLRDQNFDKIIPEYTYGNSRIDFYAEKGLQKFLIEVKGCTLEVNGIGYFPDAPTQRGIKHIYELIKAHKEGYMAMLVFVVQMDGITEVRPNLNTHLEFGIVLEEAKKMGVKVCTLPCHIEPDKIIYKENLIEL